MFNLLRRILCAYAGDKDGGWLKRHTDAEVVEEQDTGRGRRLVLQARNGETRTYLTDQLGNVVEVLR